MEKETTTITESVVHHSPQMSLMATDAAHHSVQDKCEAIGDKYPPIFFYKASEDDIYHSTKDKSTTKGDKSLRKEDSVTTKEFSLHYTPGESDSAIMGGNSNWRGPIWICGKIIVKTHVAIFYLYIYSFFSTVTKDETTYIRTSNTLN